MRRSGVLGALLATVVLMVILPGVLRSFFTGDTNRMDESLRPAQSRTLTLWLVGDSAGDHRLITQLLSAFEKTRPGLRIYLRKADLEELTAENAVLPDGLLYSPGEISMPEKYLLPLSAPENIPQEALQSGSSAGTLYGIPLWYAPNVLSLPKAWFDTEDKTVSGSGESYFGKSTPPPPVEMDLTDPGNIPWQKMFQPGSLYIQPGVAMEQLSCVCPPNLRSELSASYPSQAPSPSSDHIARAWSYPEHLSRSSKEALVPLLLTPAVSDRVRFFSICRENEDALALLKFLTGAEAASRLEEKGWLCVNRTVQPTDGILKQAAQAAEPGLYFPNAYAHTRQELYSLCEDGLRRCADPVQILLMLR